MSFPLGVACTAGEATDGSAGAGSGGIAGVGSGGSAGAGSGGSAGAEGGAVGCLEGGPLPALPPDVTFVDPTAPEGTDPATTACTRLVRVASLPVTEAVATKLGKSPLASFTYLFRGDDGAIVMIDAGYTHWVTGGTLGALVIEEQAELRKKLATAITALDPSKGLDDVAAVYLDHGHIDHIMQARWVREAKQAALEVWAGSGDQALLETIAGVQTCTKGLPDELVPYVPLLGAPDYDVHYVPTVAAAKGPGDWVDGGHGVTLIAAPSHTPGTLMILLESLGLTITSNHLKPADQGTTGDCPTNENSSCKVDCSLYAQSLLAFPPSPHVIHVHPGG